MSASRPTSFIFRVGMEFDDDHSICLIVFSLLGELPHDAMFYWR